MSTAWGAGAWGDNTWGGQQAALTGVSATGAIGSIALVISIALTGVAGTGSVGSVEVSTSIALTGVAGTGSVGTVIGGTFGVGLFKIRSQGWNSRF